MTRIVVYPCDPTQTADEAWREQQEHGRRITDSGIGEYWATRVVDDEDD